MKKLNLLTLLLIFAAIAAFTFSENTENKNVSGAITFTDKTDQNITSEDVIEHIKYLASDDIGGRFPGTAGDSLTQEYAIAKFKKAGLKPGGSDGYRQRLDFIAEVKLADDNSLSVKFKDGQKSYTAGTDFIPVNVSAIGGTEGELVFAGYGIKADDQNYNDLAQIDVKDKIAVILRYSPGYVDPHNNPFERYESTRSKVETLTEAGAKGIMIVTGPNSDSEDILMRLRVDNSTMEKKIPVIHIKREIAEKLFADAGKDLNTIQTAIDNNKTPNSFPLNAAASFNAGFFNVRANTANVIGYLEGSDPVLKNEVVVIGAHMDHLGDGTKYGSLHKDHSVEIHNGADDNASGTAGVLELAEKMGYEQKKNNTYKRSYLFMLFAAEEAGLVGSAYFTNSSLFDKYNVVSMINMDMIGRMQNNTLIVNGAGTSAAWKPMLDEINKDFNFSLSKQNDGFGSSDYSSFYSKNLPVLGFFTGLHSEYHRPQDDWNLINTKDEEKILKFIYKTVQTIDNSPSKPDFVKTSEPQQTTMTGFRVTLGVVPDYGETTDGMKITGVRAGGPAEKAGLLANDVIIKMGDYVIKNVYDYTHALGKFKPGETTDVVVKRGTEEITFKIELKK